MAGVDELLADTEPLAPGSSLIEVTVHVSGYTDPDDPLALVARGALYVTEAHGEWAVNPDPMMRAMDWFPITLLMIGERVGPWQHAEIGLTINASLYGQRKPIAWWAGDPTDMPTGLARWEWPGMGALRSVHAMVGVRRAR